MEDWRELKLMTKALADVARLTIVYYLARHEAVTVTALSDLLHLSQPLVSWHLRKLKRAGLVTTHRSGRQVYCVLNRQRYRICLESLESLVDPEINIEVLPTGDALMETGMALEE